MTNQEAKGNLMYALTWNDMPEKEALKIAIKLFDNEDVLDKIRAEIEENAYPIVHGVNNHEKGMTLYGIMQIIDKYKVERSE